MVAIENSNELIRRAFRRSWVVFGYGLVWFMALAAGFTLIGEAFAPGNPTLTIVLAASGASALAGGIGGVTSMFQRMATHLTVDQDFHRQPLISYLLQPLTGLIAGILSLFLVALPGTLLVTYATTRTLSIADVAASSTFAALQLLLAWVAGYYYQDRLTNWRSSGDTASASKSVAGSDQQPPAQVTTTRPDSDSILSLKAWVEQRQRMTHWSVTGGVFILLYGVICLVALFAGFLGSGWWFPIQTGDNQPLVNLLAAGWPAMLAGGLGGAVGMLYDLYRHISFKRDFDQQHIVAYLILPLTGLVLGGAMYLFIASGYLSFESLVAEAPPVVDAPTVIAIYLVLGWVAGFRQQSLVGLIRRLIQAVMGFFRFCLSLVSPKLLWDQARRADAFSEIAQQKQELFKPLDRNRT